MDWDTAGRLFTTALLAGLWLVGVLGLGVQFSRAVVQEDLGRVLGAAVLVAGITFVLFMLLHLTWMEVLCQ